MLRRNCRCVSIYATHSSSRVFKEREREKRRRNFENVHKWCEKWPRTFITTEERTKLQSEEKGKHFFYTCCISTLARFELIRLKRDVFRFLSEWSRFGLRCLCNVLRAILLWVKSLLRPPVFMLVFSNGVLRNVTWSPPLNINWSTCIWYKPWTGSPFICVMRSPGLKPASNAGLDWSTAYGTRNGFD